jgi:ribosome-binding protein aMBF1 (putative translation factor)
VQRTEDLPPTAALGDQLRTHRRAAGLSQEELADRTGLSVRNISDLERGITVRHVPARYGASVPRSRWTNAASPR